MGKRKRQTDREIRKIRIDVPLCVYCLEYRKSPAADKSGESRHCSVSKMITTSTGTCASHDPAQFFRCVTHGQDVSPDICLHRRSAKCNYGNYHYICKKCQIGTSLFYYLNGIDFEYNIKGE